MSISRVGKLKKGVHNIIRHQEAFYQLINSMNQTCVEKTSYMTGIKTIYGNIFGWKKYFKKSFVTCNRQQIRQSESNKTAIQQFSVLTHHDHQHQENQWHPNLWCVHPSYKSKELWYVFHQLFHSLSNVERSIFIDVLKTNVSKDQYYGGIFMKHILFQKK